MKINVQQILMKLHADLEIRHRLHRITMKINSFMSYTHSEEYTRATLIYVIYKYVLSSDRSNTF